MNLFAAYKGNHLGKELPTPVQEEDVRKELEHMLHEHVHTASKEGAAANGDIVNIDFEGFLNGVPFEGGKGEDYDLELGSHTFIPGFEEQLVNHSKGDEVDVNVTFPVNYQAKELAGKAVVFKCKVHDVKQKVQMELNDEFAKHLGLDSLLSLKEAVRKDLEKARKDEADQKYLEALLRYLVMSSTIDVTPEQVAKSKENILSYYTQSVAQYGMDLDSYIQAIGMDKAKFDQSVLEEARNSAKVDVLTDYIAKKENLVASEAEVNATLSEIQKYYHLSDDKFNAFVAAKRDDIARDCTREKVGAFLVANND